MPENARREVGVGGIADSEFSVHLECQTLKRITRNTNTCHTIPCKMQENARREVGVGGIDDSESAKVHLECHTSTESRITHLNESYVKDNFEYAVNLHFEAQVSIYPYVYMYLLI